MTGIGMSQLAVKGQLAHGNGMATLVTPTMQMDGICIGAIRVRIITTGMEPINHRSRTQAGTPAKAWA
jgi:hypothetical protein